MDKHPLHLQAFYFFKYFNFLLFVQLFGLLLFVIVQFINVDKIKRRFYTGLSIIIMIGFFTGAILFSFDKFVGQETTLNHLMYYLTRYFSFIGILLTMYTSVYVTGNFVLTKFFNKGNSLSLSLSTGLMVMILAMFALATVNVLQKIPLTIMFIVPILIGYKNSFKFVKTALFTPFKDYKSVSYWGYLVFYITIAALAINFLSILSPFPYGFDARNYYMNVTQLIAQNHGLVAGFQPYSWQLFMSTGFVIFDSHDLSILITFSSFILAMIALNEFARKIVKVNVNLRFLIICILTCTPAIYNQLSIDVKIDFALLFFQIVIVHQFFKYIEQKESPLRFLLLIGLLSGFALSIKFTHLYLITTLVIAYWAKKGGIPAMLSAASLGVAVFLIARIDDVGGLRSSHLGVHYQQYIIAFVGVALIIYLIVANRKMSLKLIRFAVLFAAFHLIPVLPWASKNYIETKSLSPKTLLIGESPGLKLNYKLMNQNYQQTRKAK